MHAVANNRTGRAARPLALAPPSDRIATMEIAMLADFALGGALRRTTGPDHPLPTVTLDLQLTGEVRSASQLVTWPSSTVAIEGGLGSATASIEEGDVVLGQCSALFSVSPSATRVAPLPWDVDTEGEATSTGEEQLTLAERNLVGLISGHAGTSGSRSWSESLIESLFAPRAAGEARRSVTPEAFMTNRGGFLQGGVLFAVAAHAALEGGGDALRLASGHIEFISSAIPAAELTVSVEPLHETRRTVFTRAFVHQDGRLVANASFVARRR